MLSSLRRLLLLVGLIVAVLVGLFAMGVVSTRLELNRRHAVYDDLKALEQRLRDDANDRDAIVAITGHLNSSNSFERTTAAAAAGRVGPNAIPLLPELLRLLCGADPFAAREAARAIGSLGPRASSAAPALIEAIEKRPDADIGWFAADSLGRVAALDDRSARACLNKALAHPKFHLAEMAARGLKSLDDRSVTATTRPAAP